jgi:acetate kinase
MASKSLIFIVNPGSASRKYALYSDGQKIAGIHFELVDGKVTAHLEYADNKQVIRYDDSNLYNAPHRTLPLLREYGVIDENDKIVAIGIRIVAPSEKFTKDQLVTDAVIKSLDSLSRETPLHIKVAILEIKQLRIRYPKVPIIAISDSAFHVTKPDWARYYGIDTKLAKRFGMERYGFHGISVGAAVNYLKKHDILMSKTIICHLGSGSSVTAVNNGKSIDNTMGYSPLEGLVMSTRSGNIDVSAALVIKRELKLTDNGLEQYLDKQAGLLGVSGTSDDIRHLLTSEAKGDERAKLALDIFVYRIQQAIGQMSASLSGVNCLVFTGTVGERSAVIRSRILERLGYLGFECDIKVNNDTFETTGAANLATNDSKPILVLLTDEATEIARRTKIYISKITIK